MTWDAREFRKARITPLILAVGQSHYLRTPLPEMSGAAVGWEVCKGRWPETIQLDEYGLFVRRRSCLIRRMLVVMEVSVCAVEHINSELPRGEQPARRHHAGWSGEII